MAVPRIVDDGSFDVAQQVGSDEWRTPFSAVGDQLTFELIQTFRIDQSRYKRLKPMTQLQTNKGKAYLVEEGDPTDIGLGLLEFKRTYSSLPATRSEYGSIIHSFQFLTPGGGVDSQQVQEWPLIVNGRTVYEYFLALPPIIRAPKVMVIDGTVYTVGGWGTMVPGNEYLSDDPEVRIYKARIYERRSVYFTYPTIQEVTG